MILKEILQAQFSKLNKLYPDKKLVIILDSIDQLNPSDYSLDWFIDLLPDNVKMIYSTLPEHGQILQKLKANVNLCDSYGNFLKIQSLDNQLSITILEDWFRHENRNLSRVQWTLIHQMLSYSELYPLYVKLIFDIVIKWPSFYMPEQDFHNCMDIDMLIKYLFQNMEIVHGRLLFSRAIIYMSSFRNGISENEIEDILSIGKFRF